MLKRLIYVLVFFASEISAQNFISCNRGLDNYVYGLYNDTVLKKLIVFGLFDTADGKSVRGIATWDGHNFDSLGSGSKKAIGGKPEMLIRFKNKLYAQFDDFYLHAYDYSTQQWQQIPGKFDGQIRDGAILNDDLYLVGDFQHVGSTLVRDIIKFNGASFDTLASEPKFSYHLNCVAAYRGEIYVGGLFDPLPFQGVAKYDGSNWVSASPNLTLDGGPEVFDFENYNGKLFMCGKWTNLNGEYNPSCASWDGQEWRNLGGLTFGNGISAAIDLFKIYENRLYVIGGFDYADTIKTSCIAVWNDTIWCGVKPVINSGLQSVPLENYKNQWYIAGGTIMSGDTVAVTQAGEGDTINYLGIYLGNRGKLERNCFEKPSKEIAEVRGLFPNPTNDLVNFNLSSDLGEKCSLKIVNNLGEIISEYQNISSDSKIHIEAFSSGVYVFIFHSSASQKTFKVVKY